MKVSPTKENYIFREDSQYVIKAEEANQIIAELMSVINWANIVPSDDPEAPQMVEALTAMLYTRTEALALAALVTALQGKQVLVYNGSAYSYISFKDLNNATQAVVDETALDQKIAAAVKGVLHFTGYCQTTQPAAAKTGELWINAAALPTSFPLVVKKYNGTAWVDYSYTASVFDLWLVAADDHSYYWTSSGWDLLDFNVDLSQYYTKTETDTLLGTKQDNLVAGEHIEIDPLTKVIKAVFSNVAAAPKSMGEFYYSLSELSDDNPGGLMVKNGPYISNASTIYETFYNWLKTSHSDWLTTWAAYQETLAKKGEVLKFVADTTSDGSGVLIGALKFPTLKTGNRKFDYTQKETITLNVTDGAITTYTVLQDGKILLMLEGAYRNYPCYLKINGHIVEQFGDDINTNTKWASGEYDVRAGDIVTYTKAADQGWDTAQMYFVPKVKTDGELYPWIYLYNHVLAQSNQTITPSAFALQIPIAEKILCHSAPFTAGSSGKLAEGSTVTASAYEDLVTALEADYQAGTADSEIIGGTTINFIKGASGKRYYTADNYNTRYALNGNIDIHNHIFARVASDTYILGAVNWAKTRTLVKSYKNNFDWYNLYSDGYLEQGGQLAAGSDANATLTLLLEFADTHYKIGYLGMTTNGNASGATYQNAQFYPLTGGTAFYRTINYSRNWTACGYAAASVLANLNLPIFYYQVKPSVEGGGGGGGIEDAPIDGKSYNRENAAWSEAPTTKITTLEATGGSITLDVNKKYKIDAASNIIFTLPSTGLINTKENKIKVLLRVGVKSVDISFTDLVMFKDGVELKTFTSGYYSLDFEYDANAAMWKVLKEQFKFYCATVRKIPDFSNEIPSGYAVTSVLYNGGPLNTTDTIQDPSGELVRPLQDVPTNPTYPRYQFSNGGGGRWKIKLPATQKILSYSLQAWAEDGYLTGRIMKAWRIWAATTDVDITSNDWKNNCILLDEQTNGFTSSEHNVTKNFPVGIDINALSLIVEAVSNIDGSSYITLGHINFKGK